MLYIVYSLQALLVAEHFISVCSRAESRFKINQSAISIFYQITSILGPGRMWRKIACVRAYHTILIVFSEVFELRICHLAIIFCYYVLIYIVLSLTMPAGRNRFLGRRIHFYFYFCLFSTKIQYSPTNGDTSCQLVG